MKKVLFGLGFGIAFLTAAITDANAQVVVNGKRLNADEINWLARYSCGPVFPGNYWINVANGYWGYVGSFQAVGHIKDRCPKRRKSLSERGLLYGPGEILNGRR